MPGDRVALAMGFRSRFVDLPDLRMHVVEAGPEDGPVIVLLHGFPEFWYGWRRQIRPLAEAGYRVIVPDQRGYNLTGKNRPYDLYTLAGDIYALFDACGCAEVCLAGHDWGAAVAWTVAGLYPGRVSRLAILNVPHPAVMARALLGKNPEQLKMSWYIFAFQVPYWPEWGLSRDNFAGLAKSLTESAHPGTFTAEAIEDYKDAWRQPVAVRAMLGWYRSVLTTMRSVPDSAYRRIVQPTRILWGDNDRFLSAHLADESLAWCDAGRVVHFPNATHWVQHEEAPAITEHLLDHFQ